MSLAARLLDVAAAVMPPHRRAWVEAMCREGQLMTGAEALDFATGCLWAAVKERIDPMQSLVVAGRWGVGVVTAVYGGFHLWCVGNALAQLAARGDVVHGYLEIADRTRGWLPWLSLYLLGMGAGHVMAAVFLVHWWPRLFWSGCLIAGLTAAALNAYDVATFGIGTGGLGWQFVPLAMLAGAAVVLAWMSESRPLRPAA